MPAREQVLSVLRSPSLNHIRFSFTALHGSGRVAVDGSSFRRVADAVANGSIAIHEDDPANPRALTGQDMHGGYCPHFNWLWVFPRPRSDAADWEATIVHESVHASMDLTRSAIFRVDDEVAAFFAETMYLVQIGYTQQRLIQTGYADMIFRNAAIMALHRRGPTRDANLERTIDNAVSTVRAHLFGPNSSYGRSGVLGSDSNPAGSDNDGGSARSGDTARCRICFGTPHLASFPSHR